MNSNYLNGLLLVIFFVVRIILKFIIEDDLDNLLIKYTNFDVTESEIIENGISLSLSFLVVGLINRYSFHSLNIRMNPYLEFISILVATVIMLIAYRFYKRYT